MLYVIYRDWTEWLEAFSTLEKARERFKRYQESNPDWNLQILTVSDKKTHITMLPRETRKKAE